MGQKYQTFRWRRTSFVPQDIRKNSRSMYARVPRAMAQFVLKIEELSHNMVTSPIMAPIIDRQGNRREIIGKGSEMRWRHRVVMVTRGLAHIKSWLDTGLVITDKEKGLFISWSRKLPGSMWELVLCPSCKCACTVGKNWTWEYYVPGKPIDYE